MVKQVSLINARIAQRYAKSLFELAQAEGKLDLVAKQFAQLNTIFVEFGLAKLASSPLCSQERLYSLVSAMCAESDASSLLQKFLNLLVKKKRFVILDQIYAEFHKTWLLVRKELPVELVSAMEVGEEMQQKFRSIMQIIVNKDVLLTSRIDKSIIGGFIANFGPYQIDASIATKLKSLKSALKEVS